MEGRASTRASALVVSVAMLVAGCWSGPSASPSAPGAVLVLAIPVDTPSGPLRDLTCRRALFEAADRLAVAEDRAWGNQGWIPAYALSPPGLPSYDEDYRQFPDGEGRGDLAAARSDLATCGHPDGFGMRIAAPPGSEGLLQALQVSLGRVGITALPAADAPADAVLLVLQSQEPGVLAFFEPLVRGGAAGDLGLDAIEPLLAQDMTDDPGMEREQGRMIDRMLLSCLRYLPLAAQGEPAPA